MNIRHAFTGSRNVYLSIAVAVVAIVAALGLYLRLTSDSRNFNKAAEAIMSGDNGRAIELLGKIDNSDSKYFQPALILGLELCSNMTATDAEEGAIAEKLEQRFNDYVSSTKFTDETFLAHAYYWHRIYEKWFYNQESVRVNWTEIAQAFENAEFKSDYLKEMAKLTAGYAYFVNADYSSAAHIFDEILDSSYPDIKSYARGYAGLMNLYGEVRRYDRMQSYALLKDGPQTGLLALYKGDGYLVDYESTLRERVMHAADCYESITLPHSVNTSTGFLLEMIDTRKYIVANLIRTEPWRYEGCTDPYDNTIVRFDGPCIDYLGNDHVASGWGVFTGAEKFGKIRWCSFGDFGHYEIGRGRFRTIEELTFDFKGGYYIAYYAKDGHTLWGTTPGINNPAIYDCNITPLTMKFDLQSLYENEFSPIHI